MVSSGTYKAVTRLLAELQDHRKLLHRAFVRKSDGELYQLLMVAHDQAEDLQAVYCLCANSQFKEIMPIAEFLAGFEPEDVVRGRNVQ